MPKSDYLILFLAGIGIGAAASVLLAPEAGGKTRTRIRDLASGAGSVLNGRAENRQTLSDLEDKAREKIDNAAEAAKKAADHVVEKSKDVAHGMGKKMEEGGKRLQDA